MLSTQYNMFTTSMSFTICRLTYVLLTYVNSLLVLSEGKFCQSDFFNVLCDNELSNKHSIFGFFWLGPTETSELVIYNAQCTLSTSVRASLESNATKQYSAVPNTLICTGGRTQWMVVPSGFICRLWTSF